MLTRFEQIDESKLFLYYACSDGYILRVLKSTYEESRVRPYKKRGYLAVKVNQKEMVLKQVIAKTFLKDYFDGAVVTHKNGDFKDCRMENLLVLSKGEHIRSTGKTSRGQAVSVTFQNGERKCFASVREAAKGLHCSYQTVLDYLNGTYSSSVLDGMLIRKV